MFLRALLPLISLTFSAAVPLSASSGLLADGFRGPFPGNILPGLSVTWAGPEGPCAAPRALGEPAEQGTDSEATGVSEGGRPDLGLLGRAHFAALVGAPWEWVPLAVSRVVLFSLPDVNTSNDGLTGARSGDDIDRLDGYRSEFLIPGCQARSARDGRAGDTGADRGNHVDFDYARWVRRKDVHEFEEYVQRRQDLDDEHYDVGRMRGKDVEFMYEIGLKGHLAPYLDTSETLTADVLGEFIEHVEGVSRVLLAIEDAFLSNNLFRPSNPFKRFGKGMVRARPPVRDPEPYKIRKLSGPTWKWRGDIHFRSPSLFEGLRLDEIILNVGGLKLSEDVEIKFDLFYLDE